MRMPLNIKTDIIKTDLIQNNKKIIKMVVAGVIFIIALILFSIINPIVNIGPGMRGVVLNFGKVTPRILGEGFNIVAPILYSVEKVDVSTRKYQTKADASSKDLQLVMTHVTLNYEIEADMVNLVFQQYRQNYVSILIDPALHEFLKATTAKYTAEELITKREMVKTEYKRLLTETLAKSHIRAKELFITEFEFSKQFNTAIEAKVQAEQEALTEKNNLEKVKYKAQQRITEATAQATAIRIQAEAVNKQGGKDYVQLKAIEKWDGKLPEQMIPGGTVPFINLRDGGKSKD
jgi:regulator of protease activity HflC (stomatin/prohibitin superfamily)